MEPKKNVKWTTSDEIKFLARLGMWREVCWANKKIVPLQNSDQARRLPFLFKYKTSMKLRKNWGDIDPKKLFSYLP